MPQPLQDSADCVRVTDTLRSLLAALEANPIRTSVLSKTWDAFRASFGGGVSPDRVSVAGDGYPDKDGMLELIRQSTAINSETRDILIQVISTISDCRASDWILCDDCNGSVTDNERVRYAECASRNADDRSIRDARQALRAAIESLAARDSEPTHRGTHSIGRIAEQVVNLRNALPTIESLATEYQNAIRPFRDAAKRVDDVPYTNHSKWVPAVEAFIEILRESGSRSKPAELVNCTRWDSIERRDPSEAIGGQQFCLLLAKCLAGKNWADNWLMNEKESGFIELKSASRGISSVLNYLLNVHIGLLTGPFAQRYREIILSLNMELIDVRSLFIRYSLPRSNQVDESICDWVEFLDGLPVENAICPTQIHSEGLAAVAPRAVEPITDDQRIQGEPQIEAEHHLPAVAPQAIAPIPPDQQLEKVPQIQAEPETEPFRELRQFARDHLKGLERKVLEVLCEKGGSYPIDNFTITTNVEWEDCFAGFKNVQSRLNPKLSRRGWKLCRKDNRAVLCQFPKKD